MKNTFLVSLLALVPFQAFGQPGASVVASENKPLQFSMDDLRWEKMTDKVYRQYAYGANGMVARFLLEKGAFIPEHRHPNEQITHIVSGSVEVEIEGAKHRVGAGGFIIIPPNKPHSFRALEDTIDMDFFSPVRMDWVQRTAGYFPAEAVKRDLEVVAEFAERPGNVRVSAHGKVFATIHPLSNPSRQLVRVVGPGVIEPFPSASWQRPAGVPATDTTFDTPLGVTSDGAGRLWVADMGLNLGKTRLFAFGIADGKTAFALTLPEDVAPKGSFLQDLVADDRNGFVYLADIANPGLVVVNLKTRAVRRVRTLPAFLPEDVDVRIDGRVVNFRGKPARVPVNPITLSADGETLYFGAMNGLRWYALPTALLREGASDDAIAAAIRVDAEKPVSAGAATDAQGNHYFTNLNEKGVDFFKRRTRTLEPLIRDARLDWCDNVSLSPDGYAYVVVNRLHKAAGFTGGKEEGAAPYFIYRFRLQP